MTVDIVKTGVANLASVIAAFERLDTKVRLVSSPADVRDSARLVLPGVGAFGAAMEELHRLNLVDALRTRIERNLPTLAVCLGLQLLAEQSEESPGVLGLGVLDASVTAFRGAVRVPQMGWNHVEPDPSSRWLESGFAYFANTYKLDALPPGWSGGHAHHGAPFVAAIERGPVLACQFHPELSGAWGTALLRRWATESC